MRLDRPLHDGEAEPAAAGPAGHERLEEPVADVVRECPGPSSRTSSRIGDSMPLPRGTSLCSAGPVRHRDVDRTAGGLDRVEDAG